jgi:hypothetical protein
MMKLSPLPCYLIPLTPKYSRQQPILKHPQSMILHQCQQPIFTPVQNNRQNYSSVYLKLESDTTRNLGITFHTTIHAVSLPNVTVGMWCAVRATGNNGPLQDKMHSNDLQLNMSCKKEHSESTSVEQICTQNATLVS